MEKNLVVKLIVTIIMSLNLFANDSKNKYVFATGELDGTYDRIAKEQFNSQHNMIYKNTAGSFENVYLMINNRIDYALTQKDALNFVDYNLKEHNDSIDNYVKQLFVLGKENLYLLVNLDSHIKSVKDLDNLKVSCGMAMSGSCLTLTFIEKYFEIKVNRVLDSYSNSIDSLQNNSIDALFIVTKKESNLLKNIKNVRAISIENNELSKLYEEKKVKQNEHHFLNDDLMTYSIDIIFIKKKGF